jgi:hypothetical protein
MGKEQNLFLDSGHGFGQTCLYCEIPLVGSNREHAPPRVMLDKPYPPNTPTVPCCYDCNNGFSIDEQYFAVLIECWRCGSSEPTKLRRDVISRTLQRDQALAADISSTLKQGVLLSFNKRIVKVVDKIARSHIYYELNRAARDLEVHCFRLSDLSNSKLREFEEPAHQAHWPEIGCRAFNDCVLGIGWPAWWELQEDRYRYMVLEEDEVEVRIVFSEFFAAIARTTDWTG